MNSMAPCECGHVSDGVRCVRKTTKAQRIGMGNWFADVPPGITKRIRLSEEGVSMPATSAHVKNERRHEALKHKGMSKERAARIANSPMTSSLGGKTSGTRVQADAPRCRAQFGEAAVWRVW